MPPRLNLHSTARALSIWTRPSIASYKLVYPHVVLSRGFADDKEPKPAATGSNQDVSRHINKEAAGMSTAGGMQLDLGKGTPVEEVRPQPNNPQVLKTFH